MTETLSHLEKEILRVIKNKTSDPGPWIHNWRQDLAEEIAAVVRVLLTP